MISHYHQYGRDMEPNQRNYLLDSLNEILKILQDKIQLIEENHARQRGNILAASLVTTQRTGGRGRPKKVINQEYLQLSLSTRRASDIAPLLDVCNRTVRRRALELGIQQPGSPVTIYGRNEEGEVVRSYPGQIRTQISTISDDEIDSLMRGVLTRFPDLGQSMLIGYFRSLGHNIRRKRIRDSFGRVNGPPPESGRQPIQRRTYRVAGPNALWHHDGHHSE
jgi:hypothetical protein